MLVIAVGLLLIAAACAVVLMEASQSILPTVGPAVGRPATLAADGENGTDWRGAALNAHADSTNLQFAIVAALESPDLRDRDAILRSALRETGARVPVRVNL